MTTVSASALSTTLFTALQGLSRQASGHGTELTALGRLTRESFSIFGSRDGRLQERQVRLAEQAMHYLALLGVNDRKVERFAEQIIVRGHPWADDAAFAMACVRLCQGESFVFDVDVTQTDNTAIISTPGHVLTVQAPNHRFLLPDKDSLPSTAPRTLQFYNERRDRKETTWSLLHEGLSRAALKVYLPGQETKAYTLNRGEENKPDQCRFLVRADMAITGVEVYSGETPPENSKHIGIAFSYATGDGLVREVRADINELIAQINALVPSRK